MPMRVEAYTATGIALGIVAPDGHLREHVDGLQELRIDESDWLPIDGSAGRRVGELQVPVDDLLVLVSDELGDVPGHAQWHAIDLDAGPFRIEGELSTMPGFDPGRALARPTGQFVLLRGVQRLLRQAIPWTVEEGFVPDRNVEPRPLRGGEPSSGGARTGSRSIHRKPVHHRTGAVR